LNKNLLNTGPQNFINENLNTDSLSVLQKKGIFVGVSQKELLEQIESKKKCKEKLPTWYGTPQIYYPNKLHIEQTSSEVTAAYKSKIIHGETLVDLTGGLGVDSYFFSKKMTQVFHCEINKLLSEIVQYNFKVLGATNIKSHSEDGIEILEKSTEKIDWVYVDPSRRDKALKRVFRLSDCFPNIPENLNFIFTKTSHILLKASPLLDISQAIRELSFVKEIHILAIRNEVKELLFIIEKNHIDNIKIRTLNFNTSKKDIFSFFYHEEKTARNQFNLPQKYLYEPNAAILKGGAFKTIGHAFSLFKLHEHTHLYTATNLIDFPGRRFIILAIIPYKQKALQRFKNTKANVSTRNFNESVAQIRKKLKLNDGGTNYLFFTKNCNNEKCVLHCIKITPDTPI